MFIDSKGRLFGKINIIDLFVVIFILSLSPMAWYGWKLSKIKPQLPTLINWKEKYNEEINKENRFLREYPRFKKYFLDITNDPIPD